MPPVELLARKTTYVAASRQQPTPQARFFWDRPFIHVLHTITHKYTPTAYSCRDHTFTMIRHTVQHTVRVPHISYYRYSHIRSRRRLEHNRLGALARAAALVGSYTLYFARSAKLF